MFNSFIASLPSKGATLALAEMSVLAFASPAPSVIPRPVITVWRWIVRVLCADSGRRSW